jgi:hypothetical protein
MRAGKQQVQHHQSPQILQVNLWDASLGSGSNWKAATREDAQSGEKEERHITCTIASIGLSSMPYQGQPREIS